MFFPKLRRKAKWVFAFLALAFALAFVVAGVGSGFGSGFGDYLADLFNRQPGADDQPSVGSARERLKKNPNDAAAQRDLGNALAAEGRTDDAIAAFETYVEQRPDDADALQTLASLYAGKAAAAQNRAMAAREAGAEAFFGNEIRNPTSRVWQSVENDPITNYVQEQVTSVYSTAQAEAQAAYAKEADVWEKLTKLEAEEPSFFFELARSSELASDYPTAIKAYRRYLVLAPDDQNAAAIRQQIKALQELQKGSGALGVP